MIPSLIFLYLIHSVHRMHHKCLKIQFNRYRKWKIIPNRHRMAMFIVSQINRLKYWWHWNAMETVRRWSRLSLTNKHNLSKQPKHQIPQHNKWPLHKHRQPISTWIERIGNHWPHHSNENIDNSYNNNKPILLVYVSFFNLFFEKPNSVCISAINGIFFVRLRTGNSSCFTGYILCHKLTHLKSEWLLIRILEGKNNLFRPSLSHSKSQTLLSFYSTRQ